MNPFEINVEDKSDYTNAELVEIQRLLNEKRQSIEDLIKDNYPKDNPEYTIGLDFMVNRCMKGVTQKLIDVENGLYPTKILYKIGNGGDRKECFVCCTPVSNNREEKSRNIAQSLEKEGFNGYFYLFNGGFPNPTGIEMKYAGVPYSFKIFMMLEAVKEGFERVVWLDAACYAVNHPQPIFDHLKTEDAVFTYYAPYSPGIPVFESTVYPETIKVLNEMTGGDLVNNASVCTIVFGLNMVSEKVKAFIEEYYEMVKVGLPFLSYFPEEVVFSAIMNKTEYRNFFQEHRQLFIHEDYICGDFHRAKVYGYSFVQRRY